MQLALDPALGDVLPLRNHPAEFRKRVGDYRVFFDLERDDTHWGDWLTILALHRWS